MRFRFCLDVLSNVLFAFEERHSGSYSAVGGIDNVGTTEVFGVFVDVVSTTSSDLP